MSFPFLNAVLSLISLWFSAAFSLSAQPKFPEEWLKFPREFSISFDTSLGITETGRLVPDLYPGCYFLETGYASGQFLDKSELPLPSQSFSGEVLLVFTKYPYRKEKWIRNYHQLLAERLTSLFRVYPRLNDQGISFRILLQTDCKTEARAQELFHGFILRPYSIPNEETTHPKSMKFEAGSRKNAVAKVSKEEEEETPDTLIRPSDNDYLFRMNSLSSPPRKGASTKKAAGCPDFSRKRKF